MGNAMTILFLLAAVCGYLCGSIPFGILVTRVAGKEDIRTIGSGNIGATNVLRTGSKWLAVTTLLLDFMKGLFPVLLLANWGIWFSVIAGLFAFLGHIFPVWLKFKGGKGVATYIGVVAGLYWPAALLFCAVWLAVALLFRMSSLAGLAASGVVAVSPLFTGEPRLLWPFVVMAAIIFYTHRENITRLLQGRESKIQLGKKD